MTRVNIRISTWFVASMSAIPNTGHRHPRSPSGQHPNDCPTVPKTTSGTVRKSKMQKIAGIPLPLLLSSTLLPEGLFELEQPSHTGVGPVACNNSPDTAQRHPSDQPV